MNNAKQNNKKPKALCPVCHQPVLARYYFCPNCGHDLKGDLKPISIMTQIGLYLFSFLLPPLGLWPGVKYIMKPRRQAKIVGVVIIGLTIISSIITIRLIFSFANDYLGQLNSLMVGL